MKTILASLFTLTLLMMSSASSVPALEDGAFVFPEASGYVTGDQIEAIIAKETPSSLKISSNTTGIILETLVSKDELFQIQYSCDLENWTTLITSVGEKDSMRFTVSFKEIDSNCAFFKIVENN